MRGVATWLLLAPVLAAAQGGGESDWARLWEGRPAWELRGEVAKVTRSTITVSRADLPAATLEVPRQAEIELDGEKATLAQLRPGQDVKVSFELRGATPFAIALEAKAARGAGAGGAATPPP